MSLRAPGDPEFDRIRWMLNCTPVITDAVVEKVCGALLIDPGRWPGPEPWHVCGFDAFDGAAGVVAELRDMGFPVVVLSNGPVTAAHRIHALQARLPTVSRIYTSYAMGMRKPDPRLWQQIASDLGLRTNEILHVGDQWSNDILGAANAGCYALHLATREQPPHPSTWPNPLTSRTVALGTSIRDTIPALHGFNATLTEGAYRCGS
ncbi:HAD family hydrolase [Amycolatopsis pigmentata]|uniref:HAD family hydrolase n=1 Tax=Amycolatopsis pigmentata TaxID=450801 RepID=A0ABW5GBX7_9PSEU